MVAPMTNLLGYAASAAVLATFLMRTMLPLRLVAIASNILFVVYGYLAHIEPVLFLHITLLPINVARLSALRDCANRDSPVEQFWTAIRSVGWSVDRRAESGMRLEAEAFDPRLIHGR